MWVSAAWAEGKIAVLKVQVNKHKEVSALNPFEARAPTDELPLCFFVYKRLSLCLLYTVYSTLERAREREQEARAPYASTRVKARDHHLTLAPAYGRHRGGRRAQRRRDL